MSDRVEVGSVCFLRLFFLYRLGKPFFAIVEKICYHSALVVIGCLALQAAQISQVVEDHVFSEGDMAVYPAHGVGLIEAIETQTIGGVDQSFYVMKILDNDMTIMIPTANSANVGLRAIISGDEVVKVVEILKQRDVKVTAQTWNRRYREYMEKIKTGSVFEVAVVLRDLFLLKEDKDLSYGERKMLDTAKNLLVKELSLAQQTEEAKIEKQIEKLFS